MTNIYCVDADAVAAAVVVAIIIIVVFNFNGKLMQHSVSVRVFSSMIHNAYADSAYIEL